MVNGCAGEGCVGGTLMRLIQTGSLVGDREPRSQRPRTELWRETQSPRPLSYSADTQEVCKTPAEGPPLPLRAGRVGPPGLLRSPLSQVAGAESSPGAIQLRAATAWSGGAVGWRAIPRRGPAGQLAEKVVPPKSKARESLAPERGPVHVMPWGRAGQEGRRGQGDVERPPCSGHSRLGALQPGRGPALWSPHSASRASVSISWACTAPPTPSVCAFLKHGCVGNSSPFSSNVP